MLFIRTNRARVQLRLNHHHLHTPRPSLHGLQQGPCNMLAQPFKGCQALPFPLCRRKGSSPHSRVRARGQGRRVSATCSNRQFFYGVLAETLCRLTESPFPVSGIFGCFDPSQSPSSADGCAPCRVPGKRGGSLRIPALLEGCY